MLEQVFGEPTVFVGGGGGCDTLEEPSRSSSRQNQIKSSVKKDPAGFQADSEQTVGPIGPGSSPRFPPCSDNKAPGGVLL